MGVAHTAHKQRTHIPVHGRPVQRNSWFSEPVVFEMPNVTICVFAVIADEYT